MILASALALAAPAAMHNRALTVYADQKDELVGRLSVALDRGIADNPRFRPAHSKADDDLQLVFVSPAKVIGGGRFTYVIDLMELDRPRNGGGVPITVAHLNGSCSQAKMVACSSAVLAQAAHKLGY